MADLETKSGIEIFRRQWALLPTDDISSHEGYLLRDWKTISIGIRTLRVHPDAPIVVKVIQGRRLVLLGIAFDTEAKRVAVSENSRPQSCTSEAVSRWVCGLSGVYAVVVDTSDSGVLVFADPGGIMGVYWGLDVVASTPSLCKGLLGNRGAFTKVSHPYMLDEVNDWYTGSETGISGVCALLANHFLEVKTGRTPRFWPAEELGPVRPGEAVEEVAAEIRDSIRAVASEYNCLFSFTGGRDSRVYAAACAGSEGRAFTIVRGKAGLRDAAIAQQISAVVGVGHEVLEAGPVPGWLDQMYEEMTGGLVPSHRRKILEACARLGSPDGVHINGNLGGISKAFYWAAGVPEDLNPADLSRDFVGVRRDAEVGISEWLQTVSHFSARTICNLMYLEQRGSKWMGPGETSSALFYQSFTPFSCRKFFDLYNRCPEEYQLSGCFLVDLVEILNPKLAEIPYASGTSRFRRMVPKSLKVALKKWTRS